MKTVSPESLLQVILNREGLVERRAVLRLTGAALAGAGWFGQLSLRADELKKQGRSCVLVWLAGGPSQFETWDPKPGTENGGDTKAIATDVTGIRIAQYWPNLAKIMRHVAIIRSMTNKEGAHARATYQLHTGRRPTGALKFPNIGSVVASELGDPAAEIPNFVSIGQTIGAGFLGVQAQPFVVTRAGSLPENVAAVVPRKRLDGRLSLLAAQDADFARAGAARRVDEHRGLYDQAKRLMFSPRLKAFQLDEPDRVKRSYGNTPFGQGLLVARRLVEAGVPFIEVRRPGWDNHQAIYDRLPNNAADVDRGLSTLILDLKQRGLLERTLVICMGEFGRTPKINPRVGRDHWPRSFSLLLAGGGVRGGQAIGKTAPDGSEVVERPVAVEDLFRSICFAMQLDPDTELYTPSGRPLKVVDGGSILSELFG